MSGNVDDGDDDVGMKPLWQVPILGTVNLIQNSQDDDLKKKVGSRSFQEVTSSWSSFRKFLLLFNFSYLYQSFRSVLRPNSSEFHS